MLIPGPPDDSCASHSLRSASPQDNFPSAKGDFKDFIAAEISDSILLSLPVYLLSGAIALRITMRT